MKLFIALCFFGLSFAQAETDLQTVSFVDPAQYVGRWYQISRNPLPFEPTVCSCAQQTLSINSLGNLDVYNSCNVGGATGPITEIRGTAYNVDPTSNAKFSVDFGFPFRGNYWIVGLAQDYSWAVVSDPDRRSLYILSKTPTLDPDQMKNAFDKAGEQLDLSKLVSTEHAGCTYP